MTDANYHGNYVDHPWAPARQAFAITPHATNPVSPLPYKGMIALTAGNLVLRALDSDADVTVPVEVGQSVPIVAEYVRATSTATVIGLS